MKYNKTCRYKRKNLQVEGKAAEENGSIQAIFRKLLQKKTLSFHKVMFSVKFFVKFSDKLVLIRLIL